MVDRSSPESAVLAYISEWSRIIWDATGDQTKVDRVIMLADLNGMFDPVRFAAFGHAQRPPAITDEMLNAHIKALGNWVEPFVAERESGVAIDSDISQEDADFFNEEERKRLRLGYAAALSVSSTIRCACHDHPNKRCTPDDCCQSVSSPEREGKCKRCGCKLFPNEMITCSACYAKPHFSSPLGGSK